MVVDCEAAIKAILGCSGFDYAFTLRDIRDLCRRLRDVGTEVRFL